MVFWIIYLQREREGERERERERERESERERERERGGEAPYLSSWVFLAKAVAYASDSPYCRYERNLTIFSVNV